MSRFAVLVLCATSAAVIVSGCSTVSAQTWSEEDRGALQSVAKHVSGDIGNVDVEPHNGTSGVVVDPAWASITVHSDKPTTPDSPSAQTFASNLGALGLPIDLSTECTFRSNDINGAGVYCTGAYGTLRLQDTSIRWTTLHTTLLRAAQTVTSQK